MSQGAPARHQGESWELATGKREPWSPYGAHPQAKTEDVEKAQITLDLVPLPARGFDSFSYFTPPLLHAVL